MRKYYMDPLTGKQADSLKELGVARGSIHAYPVFILESESGDTAELIDDRDLCTMYINVITEAVSRHLDNTMVSLLHPILRGLDFSVDLSDFINKGNKKMYCLSVHVRDYSSMQMLDGERLAEFVLQHVEALKGVG